MFDDKRSKKVLLVAHCILNQNAKIDQCAHYPGAIKEIVEVLIEAGIGLVQMPCPELLYLGLDRQADRGTPATIESEDTRVVCRMAEDRGKALCGEIVENLVYQIEEYQKNGFEVVGILGVNGSPTCGVETTWFEDEEKRGPGIFIQLLSEALAKKSISLPLKGIKAYQPQEAVAAVRDLLSCP